MDNLPDARHVPPRLADLVKARAALPVLTEDRRKHLRRNFIAQVRESGADNGVRGSDAP